MANPFDIYQVTHFMFFGNQAGMCRHHYDTITPANDVTEANIATRMSNVYAPLFKALMGSGASYLGVKVQRIFPTPRSFGAVDRSAAGLGTVAGDMLPTQVRGILTLQTPSAGRRFRGRMYTPFPGEADNAATGIPTAGMLTRLGNLGAALVLSELIAGTTGSATFRPQLVSIPKLPASPIIRGPITSVRVNGVWATQRRSGSYGRPNALPI